MRQFLFGWAWFSVCFWSAFAQAEVTGIEAYGDSLTAGFLSGTSLTNPPPLKFISEAMSDFAMSLIAKNPDYLKKYHYPAMAWPAVLSELAGKGKALPVYNVAISGAHTRHLSTEIDRLAGVEPVSHAFFFIGHNDLCNNPLSPEELAEEYVRDYTVALEKWSKRHRGSTAFLIPISDIGRVYHTLDGYVWHKGKRDYTCNLSWESLFRYCPYHYKKYKAGTLDAYLQPRINQMNARLKTLAETMNRDHVENHFRFAESTTDVPFKPEFFAVDCFHLSPTGEKLLAKKIFEEVER